MIPARFPNLFVVTYGRSGSTLLQGVLNAIPGYLIRGENEDIAGHLMKLVDSVSKRHYVSATSPTKPWFGAASLNRSFLVECSRRMLDSVLLGGTGRDRFRAIGFKEIRYRPRDLEQKVAFLEEMYPDCGVIFNTRNPADVARSEFQTRRDPSYFTDMNRLFAELAQASTSRFVVAYEDVPRMDGSLVELFDFLGESLDRDTVAAVLKRKHSYHSAETTHYSDAPYFARVSDSGEFRSVVVRGVTEAAGSVRIVARLISAEGAGLSKFTEANGCLLEASLEPFGEEASAKAIPAGVRELLVLSVARPPPPRNDIQVLYGEAAFLQITNLDKLR